MTGAAQKSRLVALELVIRAAGIIKGWETKSGGELIVEAEIVESWIRTGKVKLPTAPRPAAVAARGTKRRK